jgi:hypothetical protein
MINHLIQCKVDDTSERNKKKMQSFDEKMR